MILIKVHHYISQCVKELNIKFKLLQLPAKHEKRKEKDKVKTSLVCTYIDKNMIKHIHQINTHKKAIKLLVLHTPAP